jgi:hypothetical protein
VSLLLIGREHDQSGADSVFPEEIEDTLRNLAAMADAAVIVCIWRVPVFRKQLRMNLENLFVFSAMPTFRRTWRPPLFKIAICKAVGRAALPEQFH